MNATSTKYLAYRLFQQAVILLLFYIIALLLDLESTWLRHLLLLTGLLGGGLYVVASERITDEVLMSRVLYSMFYVWTLLLVLVWFVPGGWLLYGVIVIKGTAVAFVALIALYVPDAVDKFSAGVATRGRPGRPYGVSPTNQQRFMNLPVRYVPHRTGWTAVPLVWAFGMVTALIFDVYLLAAVALGFWLMHRFSNMTFGWANRGLQVVASLLAVAEVLLALRLLMIAVPVLYIFLAGHSYRALSDRNNSRTLAAHWYALALVLFLIGGGVMGPLLAYTHPWVVDTYLTDSRTFLITWGVIAVILGVVNQAGAELRGQNRRITGLMPFWFVASGVLGGGAALAGAGLIQVYLERRLELDATFVQEELAPLLLGWRFCVGLVLVGLVMYALGFWVRRVR